MKSLNQNNLLTGGYNEIELRLDDGEHVLPAKPPRQVNFSIPMSEEIESSLIYQDIDQQHPSTTNVPQEMDVYTVPDTSSRTVKAKNGVYETVYSEPIQPSLFTVLMEQLPVTLTICSHMPLFTLSPQTCLRVTKCY